MARATQSQVLLSTVLLLVCSLASIGSAAQAVPAAGGLKVATSPAADGKSAAASDAAHLLELARQLKASVDKTRRDELSIEVIRKADEIEKLARSVRARIH